MLPNGWKGAAEIGQNPITRVVEKYWGGRVHSAGASFTELQIPMPYWNAISNLDTVFVHSLNSLELPRCTAHSSAQHTRQTSLESLVAVLR